MAREKSLGLWKYNKRSGIWDHQRGVTPETKDQWLSVHKKDEPDSHFHVASNKPKHNPYMKEGIKDYLPSADSISAFGRNAADTATFGGYKYARAGADYAAKKGMKALGLSKQDTTYKKELDQEKQKLARDDVKNPRASAAGDIAGMGAMAIAPEIPAVGAALGSALKGGETASKIPFYTGLVKKAIGLREDVPVNNAGGGNVAGLGVGTQGEPGRSAELMPVFRRGKFAGKDTFIVPPKMFYKGKMSKKKGQHWSKYFEEQEGFGEIREYARKNPKKTIILQDENTGALYVARYGQNV